MLVIIFAQLGNQIRIFLLENDQVIMGIRIRLFFE